MDKFFSALFGRLLGRLLIGALMVGTVALFANMNLGKNSEAYAGIFCCGSLALFTVVAIISDRKPKRP